jgi:SAM-dependent methyltransferase
MVTNDAGPNPTCRSCGAVLDEIVLDLGEQPLANSYLKPGTEATEQRFPLCARLCTTCGLVQVGDFVPPEDIFSDYAYFSSYSDSWVAHGRRFATAVEERFGLTSDHTVVEIASNDGYLLQHFRDDGVGVLGVEPAANVAEVAVANGIATVVEFFGLQTAEELMAAGHQADLLVANNVFAHVPDLNDFVAGMERILSPVGVVSIEVPHLLRMIEHTQFDTIYHEHFSYVSLLAATAVLERHGLRVFDVEQLPTHGGSLRIFASRISGPDRPATASVQAVLDDELRAQLDRPAGFEGFAARATACIEGLSSYLDDAASAGTRIAAYGAAAKGNTLLNAAGVGTDRIGYVVDRSIHKQGLLLPGSHLPVRDPSFLLEDRPDEVLILPWNLRDEIVGQMAEVRAWGGRFLTAVPEIQIVP